MFFDGDIRGIKDYMRKYISEEWNDDPEEMATFLRELRGANSLRQLRRLAEDIGLDWND